MWDQGSEGWDLGSQTMGSGSAVFYRDQESGCTTFVGSGTKIGHAFGIKEQKFAYKNGISNKKTYLVTTLEYTVMHFDCTVIQCGLHFLTDFNPFTPKGGLNQNSRRLPNFIL